MPRVYPAFRRVFRFALRRWRLEQETDDEIRFHLARRTEALVAAGLGRADAEREALRRFGPFDEGRAAMLAAAHHRETRLTMFDRLDALRQDLGYALRQLRRAPSFALAAIASFALGIGANATMFGIVDRLLLRPPAHIVAPAQLYELAETRHFANEEYTVNSYSYPAYKDYRDHVPGLAAVAAASSSREMDLGRGESARKIHGMLVTASYLSITGARPALGRFFLADEDREPIGSPVAVITYGFWQRHFGGEPSALGATLALGTQRYTVVGVAPRGFTGVQREPVDVYLLIAAADGLRFGGSQWGSSRGSIWLSLYGRLSPGVSPAQVAARATALRRSLPGDGGNDPDPRLRAQLRSILPEAQPEQSPELRVAKLLVGVSAIVLLIACANVASLLVARAVRRRREIAVRLALGISRRRLVGQLIVESMLLALLGGVGALAVVRWGGDLVRATLLGNYAWDDSPVDITVLAFTVMVTLVTGLLAGVVPALGASGTDVWQAIKESARDGSQRRSRARTALLVVQTAFAVILLAGTGLFVRSLRKLDAVQLGMDTKAVDVATMDLKAAGFAGADIGPLFMRMQQRVKELPGIANVAIGGALPFNSSFATRFRVPGIDSLPSVPDGGPYVNAVTPEFFPALGIHVLRGRAFTPADVAVHAPVMVISETMARLIWRGRDPIGTCVRYDDDSLPCMTVIGIAENTHRGGIVEHSEVLQYYVPLGFAPSYMSSRILFIRPVDGAPDRWVEPLRRVLQTSAPNLPYADVRPMHVLLDGEMRPWRLGAAMFAIFGALALVLTALGLCSVVAYVVAERTHEFGLRIALGAGAPRILRMVVRRGLLIGTVGAAAGVVIAIALGRFIEPLLFRVSPRDPLILALVSLALLLVSALASALPAWRATKVDPVTALRAE